MWLFAFKCVISVHFVVSYRIERLSKWGGYVLNLLSNLQVKDLYFQELLNLPVYEGDLLFYGNLAGALGEYSGAEKQHVTEIGLLSELIYLYSLLHYNVAEVSGEEIGFRQSLQMPVLLGDLLLGRFYEAMAECGKDDCLDLYVSYIRDFSAHQMDDMDAGKTPKTEMPSFVMDMALTTAYSVAKYSEKTPEECVAYAKNFTNENWQKMRGSRITDAQQAALLLQERI